MLVCYAVPKPIARYVADTITNKNEKSRLHALHFKKRLKQTRTVENSIFLYLISLTVSENRLSLSLPIGISNQLGPLGKQVR